RVHLWVGGDRRRVGLDPQALDELYALVAVERHDRDQVRTAVAEHDRLGDVAALAQLALDVYRRDVLAARGDDQVRLAAGDLQEPVVGDRAEIAGLKPPVGRDRLRGRRLVLEVALEHVRAPEQDLSLFADRHLGARQRLANGSEANRIDRVDRARGAVLRQSVALQQ